MIKSIKLISFFFFFIILSTYSPNDSLGNKSILFPIKKIKVENYKVVNPEDLTLKLNYLLGSSLLFIKKESLKSALKSNNFIMGFNIKKIYPDTIKISITEKTPVAIYIDKKRRFFLLSNGDLITYKDIKIYESLPLVYGNNKGFKELFHNLKKLDFPLKKIKAFHYFGIGRWDIIFKNQKIIKLPKKDYLESLKNYLYLKDKKNFEKYKIFDYRINNQLILN